MSLDVSSSFFKTKLKNTILKKGFQGNDPKPEQIAWFRWLNLDGNRMIRTPDDLLRFITEHQYVVMLPSDEAFLPDLVSAVKGEIVFIAEYPRLAKQYEDLFDQFTRQYIQTGRVIDYPLIQSTSVLITPDAFKLVAAHRARPLAEDEYEQQLMDYIRHCGIASKRQVREQFRSVPYLFQRIDLYLYKALADLKLYKTGFDAIEGNLYKPFDIVFPHLANQTTTDADLAPLLEGMIRSCLYVNPLRLQRSLKKIIAKETVDAALKSLTADGIVYKAKIDKESVLVHQQLMKELQGS